MPLTTINIRIYTAIITQNATDPPISTVLKDDIGFPTTWTKDGTGLYHLVANKEWPNYNYIWITGQPISSGEPRYKIIPVSPGYNNMLLQLTIASNKIRLDLNVNNSGAELSEMGSLCLPEIRLYTEPQHE